MREEKILEKQVFDEQGTRSFASEAVNNFNPKDVILLYGKLGSGKTFLVKEFVNLLGLKNEVSSPSFTLVNQYSGNVLINHIDLYRISDQDELNNLGLDDYLDMNAINFIEWPQLIDERIMWSHFRVYIETNFKCQSWRHFKLKKYFD
jgi:tRNA threonylcarbamoyl adenosine modification protein YjeE